MASTPYPLPRETRESAILVGNGTVGPYGPSTFKIFDTLDVVVLTKVAGADFFVDVTDNVTVTKTAGLTFDTFSITFDAPVLFTTEFWYAARRVAERSVAVTRDGTIDSNQLEKELSKQATVLSELRRDIDNGLQLPPGTGGMNLPAADADKLLGWDATGTELENKPVTDFVIGGDPSTHVGSLALLRALPSASSRVARVTDPAVAGDFNLLEGDYSAQVAMDPGGAFWQKPDDGLASQRAWRRALDYAEGAPLSFFGAKHNNATLSTQALKDVNEFFRGTADKKLGGNVVVGPGYFPVGERIVVQAPGRIFSHCGASFMNQFVNNALELNGAIIALETGVDDNVLEVRIDPSLWDLCADYRLNLEINKLGIFGNRGTGFAPTSLENNDVGSCIKISGSRYVKVHGNLLIAAAFDGVECGGSVFGNERGAWSLGGIHYALNDVVRHNRVYYKCILANTPSASNEPGVGVDWATRWSSTSGAISCNNIEVYDNTSINHGRRGFDLAAGDSMCRNNQVGFTGSDGIRSTGFGLVQNNLVWNVFGHGMMIDHIADVVVTGNKVYDGVRSGIVLGGALPGGIIAMNEVLRNGVNNLLPGDPGYVNEPLPIDSSAFYIISDSPSLGMFGNGAHNLYGSNVKRQRYGYYFVNTGARARMDGSFAVGNVTDNWRVAAPSNVQWHDSVASSIGYHPGFTAQGSIDMAGNDISNIGSLGGVWALKTISAGVLAIGTDSLVEVSPGAPVNVTDVTTTAVAGSQIIVEIFNTTANAVTFIHDSAKLRLRGGVNRVLPQNGIIKLRRRSANIFVEVGL